MDHQSRAADAERRADAAGDPAVAEEYRRIAATWRDLAAHSAALSSGSPAAPGRDARGRRCNTIDAHVGVMLRSRRRIMKVSQSELAERLGITFQQVQKYEIGASRISASKLHAAAIALRMPVGAFFEGLEEAAGDDCGALETVVSFLHTLEGFELARRLLALSEGRRRAAIALIAALAEQEGGAEG